MAKTYCCREFKRQMDCTVFDYLINYRILKSIELLKNHHSITEIAYAYGFHSTSYFIKKFKEKQEYHLINTERNCKKMLNYHAYNS